MIGRIIRVVAVVVVGTFLWYVVLYWQFWNNNWKDPDDRKLLAVCVNQSLYPVQCIGTATQVRDEARRVMREAKRKP